MFIFKSPSQHIKTLIGICVGIFIVSYALFEARGLIFGPRITISNPPDGALMTDPIVYITGTTSGVQDMTLNGRTVALHENDSFSNAVVLKEGYNIVVLEARDRFGRIFTRTLQLMHKRENSVFSATSSPSQEYGTQEKN